MSLKDLIAKRSSLKGQITKFKNYLDRFSKVTEISNVEINELTLKLSKIEFISTKFDNLQTEIEILNDTSMDVELNERERVEDEIIQCIACAKSLLQVYNNSNFVNSEGQRRLSTTNAASSSRDHDFKLPQIQIAKFDGSLFRWLEFHDTFTSLVHKNDRIADIHKFHYLMSYLEGDAARILSNLEISSKNYTEAWKLLCERYDNKRVLINNHLDSLFNIEPITRESERSLRFLVDHVTKNLRALASLGQPTDHWDLLIIYILSSKLDNQTIIKWEEYRNTLEDVPSLEQFNKFLIERADVLESVHRNKSININNNNFSNLKSRVTSRPSNLPHSQWNPNKQLIQSAKSTRTNTSKSFAIATQNSPSKIFLCIICNSNHRIYDCPIFKSKSIKEKLAYVAQYKLCQNCLRQGHPISECRMGPCRQCSQRHNTLLHDPSELGNSKVCQNDSGTLVAFSEQNHNQILLSTALIDIYNPQNNKSERVRALLDSGSQSSFISKSLQARLCLKCNSLDSLNVIGIGNANSIKIAESCVAHLKSIHSAYQITTNFYVLNELTGDLPKAPVEVQNLHIPKELLLADPHFNQPAPIEVLIGADLFWDILGSEQHSLGPNKPKLHNSKLGWVIAGPINYKYSYNLRCNHATISKLNIDQLLGKFWEIEEVPRTKYHCLKDAECEKHYLKNTKRLHNGRFCVRLPLKDSPDCLGDTYNIAKRRFLNLEKRFRKNPELKSQYSEFLQEYSRLGHLSEIDSIPDISYFLCHHAVFKHDSESTKLRVVFDGSVPSSSGYSVNDILIVGPNMQDSLFSILIRARQYKFILTGDIAKMYRQVMVDKNDCNLQLILWREDQSQPIKILQLGTVTYGTASASYLSTRCLFQVGEECTDNLIKTIIQKDFYVDDLITGSDQDLELEYIKNSVCSALESACFPLRKFKTNSKTLFKNSSNDSKEKLTFSESSNTLGLGWDPTSDNFHFPVKNLAPNEIITKRAIMSNSSRIFDPLGLVSPCIIQSKMLLQKLWLKGVDWDQPVSDDIKEKWLNIRQNLPLLADLQIPRLALCDAPKSIELHSFSDASQSAYGACIYLRSVGVNDEVTVRLLCSKSKVAPLKPTTIPRLELCAALLAARLCKVIIDSLRYTPTRFVHWCDSNIVLCWINNEPNKLKTFVANRIGEILELTSPNSWRYVPTDINPADLISRGVNSSQLITNNAWWNGPSFLYNSETEWPILHHNKKENLPELKVNASFTVPVPSFNFSRYSNFNRVQRIFAYILRFLHNAKTKNRNSKIAGVLTVDELNKSFYFICQISQRQSFPLDYKRLMQNKDLEPKSKLLCLSPFFEIDTKLIRVGGRLAKSDYPYEKRHPILLDASHHITKIYFEREHLCNMHAGPQLLLSTIRESIWPINGRKLARRVVKQCVICTRHRGQTITPKMGNLPSCRVSVDFPFNSVGIDFAGPFSILNRKGRGAKCVKCYLCLFVCLRFKCVHLEPVSDLSKDAFLMTLRRFISRRGKPREIFSDNGRNFVAAAKDISYFLKLNNESVSEFAAMEGITFNFIPAYAPHFGGIWEAGIKSAKFHIKRVMGHNHLTFEEIGTLFAQVEAILNSRPLCPMSSSPSDFLPLSPGHFIIGRPLNALPAPDLTEAKEGNLQRYHRLEQIKQHFWKRWQKEYISELQQRTKWKSESAKCLNVGDLVLLQEDNTPPLCWRLGRVARLYPGSDGISRVADIDTTKGCVRRALVRLCPLPAAEDLRN